MSRTNIHNFWRQRIRNRAAHLGKGTTRAASSTAIALALPDGRSADAQSRSLAGFGLLRPTGQPAI